MSYSISFPLICEFDCRSHFYFYFKIYLNINLHIYFHFNFYFHIPMNDHNDVAQEQYSLFSKKYCIDAK